MIPLLAVIFYNIKHDDRSLITSLDTLWFSCIVCSINNAHASSNKDGSIKFHGCIGKQFTNRNLMPKYSSNVTMYL